MPLRSGSKYASFCKHAVARPDLVEEVTQRSIRHDHRLRVADSSTGPASTSLHQFKQHVDPWEGTLAQAFRCLQRRTTQRLHNNNWHSAGMRSILTALDIHYRVYAWCLQRRPQSLLPLQSLLQRNTTMHERAQPDVRESVDMAQFISSSKIINITARDDVLVSVRRQ